MLGQGPRGSKGHGKVGRCCSFRPWHHSHPVASQALTNCHYSDRSLRPASMQSGRCYLSACGSLQPGGHWLPVFSPFHTHLESGDPTGPSCRKAPMVLGWKLNPHRKLNSLSSLLTKDRIGGCSVEPGSWPPAGWPA